MLYSKDLEALVDGSPIETIALVKGYELKPAKNGTNYIDGVVEMKGSVAFKMWSDGISFKDMQKYDFSDTVCSIKGKVNVYNGVKSLILTDVKALEEGSYNKSDFFEDVYDVEIYWTAFRNLVAKNCSAEAFNIFKEVMKDEQLATFKTEFAAKSHHDAVKSGLLAHTYKVTYIMSKLIPLYTQLRLDLDTDILILGCAFHDIGKVKEYSNGVVKDNGLLVSHHTFGVEILYKYKNYIVSNKSEEFYYRLLSVIEQHHGEYGEAPRTVDAYLVHLADFVESKFQVVNETFEKGMSSFYLDNFKLN